MVSVKDKRSQQCAQCQRKDPHEIRMSGHIISLKQQIPQNPGSVIGHDNVVASQRKEQKQKDKIQ